MLTSVIIRTVREALKARPEHFPLVQAIIGFGLDSFSCAYMLRDSIHILQLLVLLHAVHFAVTCVVSWDVMSIFRVLIAIFLQRVRPLSSFVRGTLLKPCKCLVSIFLLQALAQQLQAHSAHLALHGLCPRSRYSAHIFGSHPTNDPCNSLLDCTHYCCSSSRPTLRSAGC